MTDLSNYLIIDKFQEEGSSALCLDIRNSSKIIREFKRKDQLKYHADFMMVIKKILFQYSNIGELSANDTGDGIICLFWNKTHAWSAFRIGVAIHTLIQEHLAPEYSNFLKENNINIRFGYGIGIHCGGSIIYRDTQSLSDFMFGNVLNTTSRLESFTKTFKNINILFSGHFITVLKKQLADFNNLPDRKRTLKNVDLNKRLRKASKDRVDINDAKNAGHTIWTIHKDYELLLTS
ncbi:MAG: hypothetical protein ABIT08_05015 [Bacteroidia bacterium]